MSSKRVSVGSAAVVALVLGSVAACSSTPVARPTLQCGEGREVAQPDGPVAVAVSGRANSPGPGMTATVDGLVRYAVSKAQVGGVSPAISVIDVDGKPYVARSDSFAPTTPEPGLADERDRFVDAVGQFVNGQVRAKTGQVDDLAALNLAARSVRDSGGGVVVLMDSGLQTVAPLDFRQPGLLDADNQNVVDFLKASGGLPDLKGAKVILDGIGDVADPQPRLSAAQQQHLVDLYTRVARAGGADCVEVKQEPREAAVPGGVPAVDIVPVPAPTPFKGNEPVVLPDDSTVGFLPDSDQFRDPAAAAAALQPITDWCRANPQGKIQLTGTTARLGDLTGQRALSKKRAERVRATLVAVGADGSRITADGVGSEFPGYVPDQGPGGTLLPGPAQQNRKVIVTMAAG